MEGSKLRDGKIVQSEEPLNLEMPFQNLDGFITPTKAFYVRTHFAIPKIDTAKWRLRVEGDVEKPFSIGLDELIRLESRVVPATLECAGNNRSLLEPKAGGVQWGLGAVGTAEWTGVPLSILLARAGVRPAAREIILEGADSGKIEDPKAPPGELKFARSIPLEKAGGVLLAYRMNGAELPPEHGFPVRAIVPGWYAVASIKWLERIVVSEQPFNGYFETLDYACWQRRGGMITRIALAEMQVKAEIASPVEGATLPANSSIRVRGAAWTSGEITQVELSTDGGSTWNEAQLIGKSVPNAWRLWEFDWKTPAGPGKVKLIARATDSHARTQPAERDPDRGSYMINHLLPVTVEVR
jgi:DMSO/TMAO reductase YedYZ molybdopterin-dependent catalytic subunit